MKHVYVVKWMEEIMVFSSDEKAVASIGDCIAKEGDNVDDIFAELGATGVCAGIEWQISKEEVR